MATEFVRVFSMQGFDKGAAPRWQMVPTAGDRYVALREGAGLTVSSSNPAILTVTEIDLAAIPATGERMPLLAGDRIFRLHGVGKGHAHVQARRDAISVVELQVNTKNRKSVRITFNFVKDSGGHQTARATASASQWIRTINYIYNGQANIFATLRSSRPVNVASDLGPQVMWTAGAGNEWNTVTALGDVGADMNFFMVWEYEQDATPLIDNTDAGTLGGNCIFEDAAGAAVAVTMAHEMGHFLSRPDHYDAPRKHHLMHGITDERGIHLPKADVNGMNP